MTRFIVGLDDTDMPGTPGTNQLARRITDALPSGFTFDVVLRHQLLFDPRIPYTSHNGCASIGLRAEPGHDVTKLLDVLRRLVREFAPRGSDPGLCVLDTEGPARLASAAAELHGFATRCQHEPVRQADAREIARKHRIPLEPLGGTGDGIIGALAAVGLRAAGDDGRVVHRIGWPWPDPFAHHQTVHAILARGVDEIRVHGVPASLESGTVTGLVDIGKHLRPAFRDGKLVLFVEPAAAPRVDGPPVTAMPASPRWKAVKLP